MLHQRETTGSRLSVDSGVAGDGDGDLEAAVVEDDDIAHKQEMEVRKKKGWGKGDSGKREEGRPRLEFKD